VEGRKRLQISKTVLIIIVLISIYVGFLIFSDVEKLFSTIVSIDKFYLFGGILLWLTALLLRILRWHFFLKRITDKIPFKKSSLYFLAGYSFIFSPVRAGEIIRSPFMKRDYGIPISKTASIVLVERFYDLLAVTILISFGLMFTEIEKTVVILPASFVVAMLLVVRNKNTFTKVLNRFSKIKIIKKMIPNVEESFDVVFNLLARRYFLVGTVASLTCALLETIGIYFFLIGLNGQIGFYDLVVLFHTANFAAAASMVPGGIGILEGSLIGLLLLYEIKYEVALSLVVLIRLMSTGMLSIIGLSCLHFVSKANN